MNEHKYPWYVRAVFWMMRRKYGKELRPSRTWGKVPRVFVPFTMLFAALDRKSSPLDPELRALVSVKVSQLNDCSYCADIHSWMALERGSAKEKLENLSNYETDEFFSPIERLALEYADTLTRSDKKCSEALRVRLREQFDEPTLIELTALIAFQNMSSKFNEALEIEPEGWCKIEGV